MKRSAEGPLIENLNQQRHQITCHGHYYEEEPLDDSWPQLCHQQGIGKQLPRFLRVSPRTDILKAGAQSKIPRLENIAGPLYCSEPSRTINSWAPVIAWNSTLDER